MGTALTFQMAVGFLITIFSINLIPLLQKQMGWEWSFALLSIGPILGILSMLKFRSFETMQQSSLDSLVHDQGE